MKVTINIETNDLNHRVSVSKKWDDDAVTWDEVLSYMIDTLRGFGYVIDDEAIEYEKH